MIIICTNNNNNNDNSYNNTLYNAGNYNIILMIMPQGDAHTPPHLRGQWYIAIRVQQRGQSRGVVARQQTVIIIIITH